MIRFEDLLEKVRAANPDADTELLRKAYVFSAYEHKGQVRRSGEPYLVHPLEVADVLADMRLDVVAIAAGLLHDIVEDTPNSIDKVRELFGEQVAHVVEGVTKLSALQFASNEERQAESFRKMLLAMVDDIRVILVKLADRLHNMRTLHHLPEERRIRIAQETRDIYAPIAHRLGMSKVKNELEELAFRHLEPAAYQALRRQVESRRRAAEGLLDELRTRLAARLNEVQIPVIAIEGRIKRLWSIHLKLQRQHVPLDQVYDFLALRVITPGVKDCYAVLGVIHQMWSPVPGRFKDFIAMSRPNGYQSLHTSVVGERGLPFEVQIRTEEMHRVAEEGIASHWKYKEGRLGSERDEQYFQWLRQLLEWQQEVHDPQEFMHNLRVELYPEEVYIFTPKGEVRSLPRGATPIDFAYSIHTDIGHQCVGAKVNGRIVPLRTQLANGDIIEIVTQPGHKPSRDWLNIATTSRARNKIRHFIHAEEKSRSLELGRRLFDKEVRRFGVDRAKVGPAALDAVAVEYGAQKADDLLAMVGLRQGHRARRADPPRRSGRAAGEGAGRRAGHGRQARARNRRRHEDQGARPRRPHGFPRPLLQPDSRREDRRVHHPRQGRLGPRSRLSERGQPALRPGAPDRRGMGQDRRRVPLHRAVAHQRRGSSRHPGRRQLAHFGHQHQHPRRRGDRR